MEFAVLAFREDDNFIVLAEGAMEEINSTKELLESIENKELFTIEVDKDTYESRKRYLETLNDYLESIVESRAV